MDLHLVPTESDESRIEKSVHKLSHAHKISREEAIERGEKDDACQRCPQVLLAGQARYDCGCEECPFKMGENERKRKYPRPTTENPDQPSLF
jgi:hypothetical protein